MACCHHPDFLDGCDRAFTVDASRITFGRGCLAEAGPRARALGIRRAALFTDPRIRNLGHFERLHRSLREAGITVAVYDEVRVEPTDRSFAEAARFARETEPDGYLSLGGGSVIDTCKAANLYATWPADFADYVNAPLGDGVPVPGPLKPHIACPTTSGTGSEVTGIAIFDFAGRRAKTGIASPAIRPSEALIDPDCTTTLSGEVVATSGLDVLSHALESFTARPYLARPAPEDPAQRPLSQGANPWSDLGCREALRLCGLYLDRAVRDASDGEAREQMMWAATLAGIAFGNAGVHAPHGMSYAVAGQVRDFRPDGFPVDHPMVPHGMSVIVNAPAVFRHTASTSPERHLECARLLGAETRQAAPADAGEVLAERLGELMRRTGMPNGIGGVGYGEGDLDSLTEGALAQQRLLGNAPVELHRRVLAELFRDALSYW